MRYVLVDLEATCWEKGTSPARMEIIEIGAVMLDAAAGPVAREFSQFVKPVAEPVLSDFCTRLTSIRQVDVDGADPFPVVFPRFLDWIGSEEFLLGSWGAYDLKQFRTDCARHRMELPAAFERHVNLKQEFAAWKGIEPCGMKHALRVLGLPLSGTHHRAADDVRNIARIAQQLLPMVERR
ncbi:MAG: exonuclease domain-containing protein [Planctomycetes bacterium]|nr:exonuclease domain-containing protein [Planctomycetota bacterium]